MTDVQRALSRLADSLYPRIQWKSGDGPQAHGATEYRDRAVCLVFSAACNYRAVLRIALKAFQISISSPSFFRIEHSPTELTNAATCTRPFRADAEQALFSATQV